MADRMMNLLFLCTGNSARSVLAESTLNGLAKGRFRAFSAGSHPTGRINPFAIELLQSLALPVQGLRSKSWDEFAAPGAPVMDFVITVCDDAAGEVCPLWPGQPISAHWGVADPAAVQGTDEDKRRAFAEACRILRRRIDLFLSLPVHALSAMSLQNKVKEIGKST
jgi:arsenate reductase (thioredoxin)